jgi:hypothetical protein
MQQGMSSASIRNNSKSCWNGARYTENSPQPPATSPSSSRISPWAVPSTSLPVSSRAFLLSFGASVWPDSSARDGEGSQHSGVELRPHKTGICRRIFLPKNKTERLTPRYLTLTPGPLTSGKTPGSHGSACGPPCAGPTTATSPWCRRRRSCSSFSRPCSRPRFRRWTRSFSRHSRLRTSRSP